MGWKISGDKKKKPHQLSWQGLHFSTLSLLLLANAEYYDCFTAYADQVLLFERF